MRTSLGTKALSFFRVSGNYSNSHLNSRIERMPPLQHLNRETSKICRENCEIVVPEVVEPLQVSESNYFDIDSQSELSDLSIIEEKSPSLTFENPLFINGLDIEICQNQISNLKLEFSIKSLKNDLEDLKRFQAIQKESRFLELETIQRENFSKILGELKQIEPVLSIQEKSSIENKYFLNSVKNQKNLMIRFVEPQNSLIKGHSDHVLVIQSGGGLRPPTGPPNDGGGNSGDDFGDSALWRNLFFSLLFFLVTFVFYRYGLRRLEDAFADLQKHLQNWVEKDPENKKKRIYALFLKGLALLMEIGRASCRERV